MQRDDDWPEVRVTIVRPGGVAVVGEVTCRVATGYLHDPDDGLLEELATGREAVPWRSAAARDEAMASVSTRGDLSDDIRARLLRHVRRTPFYVDL
jgi:hypothetical protein